jgi:Flp pilus assembly pilin Flp
MIIYIRNFPLKNIFNLFNALLRNESGQATVEYVIVASVMVTAFIAFNKAFYEIIQSVYKVFAFILSLPIP